MACRISRIIITLKEFRSQIWWMYVSLSKQPLKIQIRDKPGGNEIYLVITYNKCNNDEVPVRWIQVSNTPYGTWLWSTVVWGLWGAGQYLYIWQKYRYYIFITQNVQLFTSIYIIMRNRAWGKRPTLPHINFRTVHTNVVSILINLTLAYELFQYVSRWSPYLWYACATFFRLPKAWDLQSSNRLFIRPEIPIEIVPKALSSEY